MEWKVYNTIPGGTSIIDGALRHKNILKVKREGKGFDIIEFATLFAIPPSDGSRLVSYSPTWGYLIFPSDETFEIGETVYVLFD